MNVYIYACVHTCARTHIYTHSFSDSFHSRLLHIKYSSLCYMVGLCCLPILYIVSITLCLVAQLYLTLCNTKDCVFEELGRLLCPWGFSRQEYWSAFPCPPPGDLPNPEMELRSPALQADSLTTEPQEKPKNTGASSLAYPFSRGSSQPKNRTGVSCIAGRFFTN